jgi:uncharacterized repeat protein (TIGR02543 family)
VTDIEGATYDEVMTVNVLSAGQFVTYNGNGNTGGGVPVDGNGYSAGATVTVLGNANNLTKSGFLFSGWNRSSDGSGTSHAPGATFTIGASDVTLHAMWTAIGPGPVDHFDISPIASPQTAGTPITGITITARDASNNIATGFTDIVIFGGTGGFAGASDNFTDGVLGGVSVIPTVAGGNLTFTATDSAGHIGSVVITTIQSIYASWSGDTFVNPFTDTDPASNPDGDSLINLLEFAFGMDPTSSVLNPVSFDPGGDVTAPGVPVVMDFATAGAPHEFHAVFACRKDHQSAGITYTVEFSADLGRWTAGAAGLSVLTGENGSGDLEAASVPFPAKVPVDGGGPDQAPRFFRVAVSHAAP